MHQKDILTSPTVSLPQDGIIVMVTPSHHSLTMTLPGSGQSEANTMHLKLYYYLVQVQTSCLLQTGCISLTTTKHINCLINLPQIKLLSLINNLHSIFIFLFAASIDSSLFQHDSHIPGNLTHTEYICNFAMSTKPSLIT